MMVPDDMVSDWILLDYASQCKVVEKTLLTLSCESEGWDSFALGGAYIRFCQETDRFLAYQYLLMDVAHITKISQKQLAKHIQDFGQAIKTCRGPYEGFLKLSCRQGRWINNVLIWLYETYPKPGLELLLEFSNIYELVPNRDLILGYLAVDILRWFDTSQEAPLKNRLIEALARWAENPWDGVPDEMNQLIKEIGNF